MPLLRLSTLAKPRGQSLFLIPRPMTILITQNSFGPTSQNFVGRLLEAIFCLVLKREIIIDILSEATFFALPLLTRTRINPLIRKKFLSRGLGEFA